LLGGPVIDGVKQQNDVPRAGQMGGKVANVGLFHLETVGDVPADQVVFGHGYHVRLDVKADSGHGG
jgi:hypothetical protein